MRIIKQSERTSPKVSLILLDWGVRESFHLLHYLKTQTLPRADFEVIVIEYYDNVSAAVQKFESEIDTWALLQMPRDCYYHKHLMYNAGIALSRGDILMFGDSDAMVRPTFVERIVKSFDADPLIVYHMDQFRNVRRDFYPFNYPSFEDVLGDGCINNEGGKTKGVLDTADPIHTRNYGACMCGRREDILTIGGADEDLTYLGHVCGPYDMTFRLMNLGRRLVWDTDEFLYHTWHPGTDGTDNYLGPHDGRNMSTTALESMASGRTEPLVENKAVRKIRTNGSQGAAFSGELSELLINPEYKTAFSRATLPQSSSSPSVPAKNTKQVFASYRGFDVYKIEDVFYAIPESIDLNDPTADLRSHDHVVIGESFSALREELDNSEARLIETISDLNICLVGRRYAIVLHSLGTIDFRVRTQREDPRILWADSLKEARQQASRLGGVNGRAQVESEIADEKQFSDRLLLERIDYLSRKVSELEADIQRIYQSRIWKTLVKMGGILDAVFGRRSRPEKPYKP